MPEERTMLWTIMGLAAGLVVLAAAAVLIRRRAGTRIRLFGRIAARAAGSHGSPYGFTSEDAARFHRSARDQMRRHQAQWSRDYLPGRTDGSLPGRIAGIPRALRVRR
jgi:hypothetical protein